MNIYHHFYREAFCYINNACILVLLLHDYNIDDYCMFPMADIIDYPKFGGLKQYKLIIS